MERCCGTSPSGEGARARLRLPSIFPKLDPEPLAPVFDVVSNLRVTVCCEGISRPSALLAYHIQGTLNYPS